MLFQGEEWGARTPFLYFTDHQDPNLAHAVTEGRTREFASFRWAGEVPDPQAEETFERSKLDWSEMTRSPHAELLEWHRRLIALRASRSLSLRRARPRIKYDDSWLRFEHAGLAVLCNFGDSPRRVALPPGVWELALDSADAGGADPARAASGSGVQVPGLGTMVYRKRG
jgi:maltooligosyltrehalose trehalohydrolase